MAASNIENDSRFKHILSDPRFKRAPRNVRKVNIDPRFKSMFTDHRFKVKYTVDKRGRKVKQTSNEDLRKYYALNSNDASLKSSRGKGGKDKKQEPVMHKSLTRDGNIDDDDDDVDDDSDDVDVDYARGEGDLESSSSDSEDDYEEDSNEVVHDWGEPGDNVQHSDDTSARLAVCNMNWDRINAQDLYVLFNSFKPQGSIINSVTIYPSDFGLQRMAVEEVEGPIELTRDKTSDDTTEGKAYSIEKLRHYQLNRLKYYYAVVEFDSPATAEAVYGQCDGLEYEHSASVLDLRFIPDNIKFDDRSASSSCTDANVIADYHPTDFCTTALQQTNVRLTWDETDSKRVKAMKRNFNKDDVMEMDFAAYLASSDEEIDMCGDDTVLSAAGEEGKSLAEEKRIANYRSLLAEVLQDDQRRPEQDMEITFEPGLQETAEELVQRKLAKDSNKGLTTWETYLKEKKQKKKKKSQEVEEALVSDGAEEKTSELPMKKRKRKKVPVVDEDDHHQKSQLELLVMDNDDGKEHFNLKGILKKEKVNKKRRKAAESANETQDTFQMDLNDPRFLALYKSHKYAIDPSNPQYKPTKGMNALMEEGLRKRKQISPAETDTSKQQTSIEVLIKSVKSKVSQHNKTRLKHSKDIYKNRT